MVIKLQSFIKNASSRDVQMLKFVKLDLFVINGYVNPISFQATLSSLKLSIRFLPDKSKNIMTGDFKALSYDNINSYSILKLNEARIKRFTQLKEQILDCLVLLSSHSRMIYLIIHIMTKNKKLLRT